MKRVIFISSVAILYVAGMIIGVLSARYVMYNFGDVKGLYASLILLLGNLLIATGDLLVIRSLKKYNERFKVLRIILTIHAIFGAAMAAFYIIPCGLMLMV